MLTRNIGLRAVRPMYERGILSTAACGILRYNSTQVPAKKKKPSKQTADISQVPIKSIGVIADFYIPPKYLASPITSWPKLFLRRLGLFAINTYSVVKYRRETGLKLKFDYWKEHAIQAQVRVNKVFSAACNLHLQEREKYIREQLNGVAGDEVIKTLVMRAATFPPGSQLSWELVSIVSNPKMVSFNALPDANNIATYVQFVVKVTTKQKVKLTKSKEVVNDTERVVTDNLVYTLDPFSDELVLVGSLFDSDSNRGVQPEIDFSNSSVMIAFQKKAADIFRLKK